MKNTRWLLLLIVIPAFFLQWVLSCAGQNSDSAQDSDHGNDDDSDVLDDDNNTSADDDVTDDDIPNPTSQPKGHKEDWDCYLCHAEYFLGAKEEPHNRIFTAPEQCVSCHAPGEWEYTNPQAPVDHGATKNCLNCHQGQHEKTWTDWAQCFVCHQRQGQQEAPTSPQGHDAEWNCYLCHAEDFHGAQGEPHGHQYSAPDECNTCHDIGSWPYTNPNAPEGHGSTANCLNCHQGEHDKTWENKSQCLVCHENGANAPTAPTGHEDAWNCYLCHAEDFHGAQGEPHGHQYAAPDECNTCHDIGSWPYTNPNAPEGHGSTANCLNCHQGEHDKTWENKSQCLVCHENGASAPPYSNLHNAGWNCYICHATAFNGAPREPHAHQYSAPDECTVCHQMGSFSNPRHGPRPEEDHQPSSNCLTCHAGRHGKAWEDKSQCLICHQF